ncbi:LuxR C-terminal-related transcriptional regulator [Ruania halotolerans]|uniref:LuxR C-terminal-related transcriptional regulator n=1 Tax=Ruania halotolerans TaxID=2897773 RepID=UPI001E404384|nr:LuxR C-terminal-related transcriptional regulator [Ruania halotolerans]UFU06792.1 LuxR C-terminal-related transcriptional regulator [Ruania halotolerans]
MDGGPAAHQRSSLISVLGHLGPGSVALISGPYGSGRATVVRQWLAARGYRALWWSTARAVPRDAEAADCGSPDVVVVRLHDGGAHDVESIRACRRCWPTAILAVVSPYGWPEGLRSGSLRPEVAIVAHDLAFTAEQTAAWADEIGVNVSLTQAAEIVAATGGYSVAVDAVVRRAAAHGGYDSQSLARGCDDAVAELSAAASAGVVPWDLWEVSLLAAQGGTLSAGSMESLWGRPHDGMAALRVMRDGGVIAEAAAGRLALAPAIRAACQRRLSTDVPTARHWQIVEPLLDGWAVAGHLDDAAAMIDTPAFDGARAELMARHWEHLAELPVAVVRERLTRLGPNPDPHLLVALVRALIDVTHEGHTGAIAPADQDRAAALLATAESARDLSGAGRAMTTALHAVSLRAAGRHDRAHAVGERALADPALSAGTRAAVLLQAGLSAMCVGALPTAAERFVAAVQFAREAGQARIGQMAAELEELVHTLGADPTAWWRHSHAGIAGTAPVWPKVARLVELIRAVRAVDVDTLLELRADDVGAVTVADPVVLDLFGWCFHAMALELLGRPHVALTHTEMLQTALADHELSGFERRMLVVAQAEALAATGQPSVTLEVLAEHYADPEDLYDVELLRARAEIASGEHAGALARLQRTIKGHNGRIGRHTAWGNVLLAMAHRGLGQDRESDRWLEAALATGARNGQRQPFARQGREELSQLIMQADGLELDPLPRRFTAELVSMRDALRAATAPVALTNREQLLLAHLVRTEGVRRLAGELHVSPNTVKSQLRMLYRKLEVSSRSEAIRVAHAMRLVSDA